MAISAPPVPAVRTVTATRYVTPLRQGGSLPAVVEADDDGLYVVKFRGAAQGVRALISELVAGEIARSVGLLVPEIVFVEIDPALGRSEPDPDIQDLLNASAGRNAGLDFLPGSLSFDPRLTRPAADLAATVVWLDAFVSNVDRTPRNANILTWHKRLWLIDHGAALYFHHAGGPYGPRAGDPFLLIADHVLLQYTSLDALRLADESCTRALTPDVIRGITGLIPDDWLDDPSFDDPVLHRQAYAGYLLDRLAEPRQFLLSALDARAQRV